MGKQAYYIEICRLFTLLVIVLMPLMLMGMFMLLMLPVLYMAVRYKVVACQQNVGNRKQDPTK